MRFTGRIAVRRESADAKQRRVPDAPITDSLKAAGVATAVILSVGCVFNSEGMPISDKGSQDSADATAKKDGVKADSIADKKVADARDALTPDKGADLNPDKGADVGPDMGKDVGPDITADQGKPDITPDLGQDSGGDLAIDSAVDGSGPKCVGVTNIVASNKTFQKYTTEDVGGYGFRYTSSPSATEIKVDISCISDSNVFQPDYTLTTTTQNIINVPDDKKRIKITVHSKDAFKAEMTVIIENL